MGVAVAHKEKSASKAISLPTSLLERAIDFSWSNRTTFSGLVQVALAEYLERNKAI